MGHKCILCGKICQTGTGLCGYGERMYCYDTNDRTKGCWREHFEENNASIKRIEVSVTCPFCKIESVFGPDQIVKGICRCGARFSEGYDEIVDFTKGKTEYGVNEVKKFGT